MCAEFGPRVELIAVDLDGTLLAPDGHVSPRTVKAVRGALDAGIRVVIATGRTWWESRAIVEAAGLADSDGPHPGVFGGGAVVNDMATGRTLAKTTIDPVTAMEISRIIEDAGYPAMILHDVGGSGAEFLISDGITIPQSLQDWFTHHKHDIITRSDLARVPHPGTLRVTTALTAQSMREIGPRLETELAGRCVWHAIRVPAYDVNVLEVFHPAVSKWHGLVQLAALTGIDAGRIVALGDDVNDLAMLRHAMLGVAMGNARPEAVEVADLQIGPHSEDGLARFLEELVKHGSRRSLKAAR
ncbi:MAG: HAD hydrolase family protein [Tepidisphaeraceae bacterium]